ncbi:MAG: hypothetical protein ACLFVE_10335 [Chitinispirillaceae bacterium]
MNTTSEKTEYLKYQNSVLLALRQVNKQIFHQENIPQLMKGVCDILAQISG